jgi:hypothetical protein
MDNVSQFQFELMDVAKLLLAREGIKEGKWTLGVNFAIGTTIAGQTEDAARPTVLISVDRIIVQRAEPNTPRALVVDAAEL